MAITVQLPNYRLVDIVIVPLNEIECTININKETLAAAIDEEAIVLEQRVFILFTKHTYTVSVKSYKERLYAHCGSNIEELHWWISYGSATFYIDTVEVYIDRYKKVIDVYIPDDAKVIRNDHV